jgi:hypothetical protein
VKKNFVDTMGESEVAFAFCRFSVVDCAVFGALANSDSILHTRHKGRITRICNMNKRLLLDAALDF